MSMKNKTTSRNLPWTWVIVFGMLLVFSYFMMEKVLFYSQGGTAKVVTVVDGNGHVVHCVKPDPLHVVTSSSEDFSTIFSPELLDGEDAPDNSKRAIAKLTASRRASLLALSASARTWQELEFRACIAHAQGRLDSYELYDLEQVVLAFGKSGDLPFFRRNHFFFNCSEGENYEYNSGCHLPFDPRPPNQVTTGTPVHE